MGKSKGKESSNSTASSTASLNKKGAGKGASEGDISKAPTREGPSRQDLFGNWTGKLPINLLQEHIQRQASNGWQKPIYHFNERKGTFQCKITLGKKNKKSGEIETFTYYAFNEFYASKQEAKHSCCTYVLHRLLSDKSYHTLLPPSQRTLWQKYEKLKHDKDPDVLPLEYAADPWEAREKHLLKVVEKSATDIPSNPWDDYPTLYIPKDLREKLEIMIRDNMDDAVQGDLGVTKDTRQIRQLL
jgi:ATP-dependent RNA helicase DHX57